jgi:HK97 family phage prohead protease
VSTQDERRAADARRAAAEKAVEQVGGGDVEFRQQRSAAPMAKARREPATGQQLRAEPEMRNGKQMLHTFGYFTAYNQPYPMWDDFGAYHELTARGSGAATLARKPDLGFLINHTGVTMARTKTGTLLLREDDHGGYHDAWMNLERGDVRDLKAAIEDGDIDEMSFAFYIPDGAGLWSDDFTTFEIRSYDLERGDVSAVNYGANPYTDIAARSGQILRSLDALPAGARMEAAHRLGVAEVEQQIRARERIVARSPMVDRTASEHVRMLQWRKANTADRYARLAADTGYSVPELMNVALPWYEVVARVGVDDNGVLEQVDDGATTVEKGDATDILIYDEIGGSFGTTADQFVADLAAITTPRINLRINSPGGSVVDAVAIASSLRHASEGGQHLTAFVDGIAASAATIIAIACDEVVTMPGAQWMVHFASSTIDGNKLTARKMDTFLDRQDANIADQYAAKAGGSAADWLTMMEEETWFTAHEAQDAGLADRVWTSGTKRAGERACDDPRMSRRWDNLPYRFTSREAAPNTQMRRSLVADPVDLDKVGISPEAAAIIRDGGTLTSRSTPEQPRGRSIARIEAEFAAQGVNLTE